MVNRKLPAVWFGGDYNPDQWDEQVWKQDVEEMKRQHVNVVTLPVFSWAHLQPAEDHFDFEWLDRILDLLYENGIHVIMATPTAAQPAWMSKKYPEILPVDIAGRKKQHGARNNFCPNNETYRMFSRRIAGAMAKRYCKHPAIVLWHVNNEYGTRCYCENCSRKFRSWLKERYGNLETLNERWNTRFWGHTYYQWDEISAPTYLNEMLYDSNAGRDITFFPSMAIDYDRFMSQSIQGCFENERDEIRKYMPDTPITTNVMAPYRTLDLFSWGKSLDVLAWDCYPSNDEIIRDDLPAVLGMKFDLMRGVKNGQPFLLMEQTPSQQNWLAYNSQKRPGVMRLWSYQALAHGSESVLFFQWRQSRSGFEKYHAAMLPHAGHSQTRVCRELTQLGSELESLRDQLLDAKTNARVAIVFDWPNWWTVEYSSGPSVDLRYQEQVENYYKVLHKNNIAVDIVSKKTDLSKYDIILAPVLCMVDDEFAQKCKEMVKAGKTFITTFFSGMVDENDRVILGGYPGAFRELLGIWVEETDALLPQQKNRVCPVSTDESYLCGMLCDVVHAEGAQVKAVYGEDYYAGMPCVTENKFGSGKAVYVATAVEEEYLEKLLGEYCAVYGIEPTMKVPEGVEVTCREKCGEKIYFILNHTRIPQTICLPANKKWDVLVGNMTSTERIDLSPCDVLVLKEV